MGACCDKDDVYAVINTSAHSRGQSSYTPSYSSASPLRSAVVSRGTTSSGAGYAAISQVERGIAVQANHICAWLVLDASGSMSGDSWRRVMDGVRSIMGQLTPTDFIGVLTFNNSVQVIDVDMKQNINLSKLYSMRPEGGTALYDAIIQTCVAASALHLKMQQDISNVISYIIILTDGEDNESKGTLSKCKEVLSVFNQFRNLKVIFAGVNLTPKASGVMQQMAAVGDSDFEYRHLRSSQDITDLFTHISVSMIARVRTLVIS